MKTDAQLVESAKNDDMEAFGVLFARYERKVYSIALSRTKKHEDAQDMVQNVFIQAIRKIHTLQDGEKFASWLNVIAKRLSLNFVMRKDRCEVGVEFLETAFGEVEASDAEAIQSEFNVAMREAIESLKPMFREILVAFYIDGKSIRDISEEFQLPDGTIKRRLHTARQKIGKSFNLETV